MLLPHAAAAKNRKKRLGIAFAGHSRPHGVYRSPHGKSLQVKLATQKGGEALSTNSKLRFGLWYDFRNPPAWKRPYDQLYGEIFEQIAWAEQHGFEDVWLSEHHFIEDGYSPALLPIAAAIAARTKKIRIGTSVMLLPFHHPVRLAEDAATVDVISGGRFELGVGTGYKVEEFSGFAMAIIYLTNPAPFAMLGSCRRKKNV